jgi:hypothetical protein
MKISRLALLVIFSASACIVPSIPCRAAQEGTSTQGRSGQTEATLAPGTPILVELNSGMDSKKLKAGDAIVAHTTEAMKSTDDRTIMPKNTKIEGHVTQSAARSKGGDNSSLGIQFDKASLKDGGEIPLNVVIQALAGPSSAAAPMDSDPTPSPSNTGTTQTSPMSGGNGHMGAPNAQAPSTGANSPMPPSSASPRLDSKSRGAIGMHGLTLNDEPANNRPASVIVSNGKSVHLEGGTQLLLVVQPQASQPSGQ